MQLEQTTGNNSFKITRLASSVLLQLEVGIFLKVILEHRSVLLLLLNLWTSQLTDVGEYEYISSVDTNFFVKKIGTQL